MVWTKAILPYVRDPDQLPATLPTIDEIRNASDIVSQRTGQTIVIVGSTFLIKYGRATPEREGQTLLYLEHALPKLPVPRLYAMYHDGADLFVVMERIHGPNLNDIWQRLTHNEKESITQSLRTTFDDMRQATGPETTRYGSVEGTPIPHHLFWDPDEDPVYCGPFDNESQFNSGLLAQYKRIQEENNLPSYKLNFYSSHLGDVLSGHRPVFTHADVQRKNMIVIDQNETTPERLRSCKVALVDWESAGFYPEYWEYFAAFVAFRWNDDWSTRFEDFLDAYPAATTMMTMLYKELFF